MTEFLSSHPSSGFQTQPLRTFCGVSSLYPRIQNVVFVVFVFLVTCSSWLTTTLFILTVKRVRLCHDRTLLMLQQASASAASCPAHSSSFYHLFLVCTSATGPSSPPSSLSAHDTALTWGAQKQQESSVHTQARS